MKTTPRRNWRTQRTPKFNLEPLDDRIVPSSIGTGLHVTSTIATVQVRPEEIARIVHEPRLAEPNRTATMSLKTTPPHKHLVADVIVVTPPPKKTPPTSPAPFPPRKLPVGIHPYVAAELRSVYAQFETYVSSGGKGTFSPTGVGGLSINGPDVGIKIHTTDHANFKRILARLEKEGLQITEFSAKNETVVGVLPIAELATVVKNPSTLSITLPPNVSVQLQSVYSQYETYVSTGDTGPFTPTGVNGLMINGTDVGVNVHTTSAASFETILANLESDGLQVTQSSATYGLIQGMLPIGQLPIIANISPTLSITAIVNPTFK